MKQFYSAVIVTAFGATLFWLNPVSGQQPYRQFERRVISSGSPAATPGGSAGTITGAGAYGGDMSGSMTFEGIADDGVQGLLHSYKESKDEKAREVIRGQIVEIVEKQFDERQKQREEELTQLEERVRKLRELHDLRNKEKQQIVNDHVHQILREALGLGWGTNNKFGISISGDGMEMMQGRIRIAH